jgi:hypothetical protein
MKERPRERVEGDSTEILNEKDSQIISGIRNLPQLDPPAKLMVSVMQSIQPKKLARWRRFYRWAISPKAVTYTPLRLAPVAALLVVVIVVGILAVSNRRDAPRVQTQGEHRVPVVFQLNLAEAQTVSVIGTFNGWKGKGYELQFDREKKVWSLLVPLPEGRYEYAFLVNGEKIIADPDSPFYQEDGFGNQNSILILREKNGKSV